MTYNKTKRTLEKVSGITGIVISALNIFGFIALIVVGAYYSYGLYDEYYYINGVQYYTSYVSFGYSLIVISSLMIAFSISVIIFGALILKSPINQDGTLKNRKGIRICMLVFTIISGNWISAGFMIAVLCCKDYVDENGQVVNYENMPSQVSNYSPNKVNIPISNVNCFTNNANFSQKDAYEFYSNLIELKHFKEIGVIDEETFKNAVQKVVNNILERIKN